jgi:Xaa-Pro dipeptidase
MTTTIKTEVLIKRHEKLAAAMSEAGLDGMVFNPGPSLVYLTGMHFHLSERPVVAAFTPGAEPILVLPELEARKVEGLSYELEAFTYGENPSTWMAAFDKGMQAAKLNGGRVGVEAGCLRVLELRLLEEAVPQAEFIPSEETVAKLRMYKDDDEVAAMRKAVHIAQEALSATLPLIKAGMSERELAAELTLQVLRHHSDPQLPFTPIVSTGPNSANPHAFPSNRPLAAGDLLVIDWGANYGGYFSDITRTFGVGELEEEFVKIHRITQEANAAARALAAPGVTCGEVDRAARKVIEEAGYGEYFTHRTGHGLGMEGHEAPYIRGDSEMPLEAGMTFTIEPGIYLPERGGVRVEDDVVITPERLESLTDLPRELITVG